MRIARSRATRRSATEYADGVSAVSPDGETTGENSAGVALEPAKKIADNWYSIDFSVLKSFFYHQTM